MDINERWATRIAEVAVPEEVDLAPFMVQAFLHGGQERAGLYAQTKGTVPGSSGLEVGALIPTILQGIALVAPVLYSALSSDALGKFLSAIKDLITIHESLKPTRPKQLPDNPYAPLKGMVEIISRELERAHIPETQRDLIAYRVLRALLEDPDGATVFVKNVAAQR